MNADVLQYALLHGLVTAVDPIALARHAQALGPLPLAQEAEDLSRLVASIKATTLPFDIPWTCTLAERESVGAMVRQACPAIMPNPEDAWLDVHPPPVSLLDELQFTKRFKRPKAGLPTLSNVVPILEPLDMQALKERGASFEDRLPVIDDLIHISLSTNVATMAGVQKTMLSLFSRPNLEPDDPPLIPLDPPMKPPSPPFFPIHQPAPPEPFDAIHLEPIKLTSPDRRPTALSPRTLDAWSGHPAIRWLSNSPESQPSVLSLPSVGIPDLQPPPTASSDTIAREPLVLPSPAPRLNKPNDLRLFEPRPVAPIAPLGWLSDDGLGQRVHWNLPPADEEDTQLLGVQPLEAPEPTPVLCPDDSWSDPGTHELVMDPPSPADSPLLFPMEQDRAIELTSTQTSAEWVDLSLCSGQTPSSQTALSVHSRRPQVSVLSDYLSARCKTQPRAPTPHASFSETLALVSFAAARGRVLPWTQSDQGDAQSDESQQAQSRRMLPVPLEPAIPTADIPSIKSVASYRLNQMASLRARLASFAFELVDAPEDDDPSTDLVMPDLVFDIASAVTFVKITALVGSEHDLARLFNSFTGAFDHQLVVLELYGSERTDPLAFEDPFPQALQMFKQLLRSTVVVKLSFSPYDSAKETRAYADKQKGDTELWMPSRDWLTDQPSEGALWLIDNLPNMHYFLAQAILSRVSIDVFLSSSAEQIQRVLDGLLSPGMINAVITNLQELTLPVAQP